MTPKFHWLLHLAELLRRFGRLFNCFCLERKHRGPKRYASDSTNSHSKTGKSLVMEVTSHHLGQLADPDVFCFDVGLTVRKKPSLAMQRLLARELGIQCDEHEVLYSQEARFSPIASCMKNDIVLCHLASGYIACKVHSHYEIDGAAVSLISKYTLQKMLPAGEGCAIWSGCDDGAQLVETSSIVAVVIYSILPDETMLTLLPTEYRS